MLEARRKAGQTLATGPVRKPYTDACLKPLQGVKSSIIPDKAFQNISTQRAVIRHHPDEQAKHLKPW